MIVKEMLKLGEDKLFKAHCMDPKIDAEALYRYMMDIDRVKLFLQANDPVDQELCDQYFTLIETRASRVPLQHITGTQEFMGLTFTVNPDVLIPRQDTETLVEEAAKMIRGGGYTTILEKLKRYKRWKVLDLCCGSGAIGISLAKICGNASVTAADISGSALAVAKENNERNRTEVRFLEGDLFEPVKKKKFDLIITNPPYIRTHMIPILQEEVKEHEPLMALDGGRDGLDFYRRIIKEAPGHLRKAGVLMMEIGHEQAEDIRKLIANTGAFAKIEIIRDLPGKNRVVRCKLSD